MGSGLGFKDFSVGSFGMDVCRVSVHPKAYTVLGKRLSLTGVSCFGDASLFSVASPGVGLGFRVVKTGSLLQKSPPRPWELEINLVRCWMGTRHCISVAVERGVPKCPCGKHLVK